MNHDVYVFLVRVEARREFIPMNPTLLLGRKSSLTVIESFTCEFE